MRLTFWGKSTYHRRGSEEYHEAKLVKVERDGYSTVVWIQCGEKKCEIRLSESDVEKISKGSLQ